MKCTYVRTKYIYLYVGKVVTSTCERTCIVFKLKFIIADELNFFELMCLIK